MRGITIVVVFALSLGACSFKKDSDKSSPAAQQDVLQTLQNEQEKQAANGNLNDKNVAVKFTEDEPGYYIMHITWPSNIFRVKLQINNRSQQIFTRVSSYEEKVENKRKFKIVLTSTDQIGSDVSSLEINKAAPTD